MPQLLLFPDPRPLVERLGPEFFRQVPDAPGVYLMRDSVETVLYVGKAKNLRRRLSSYRVANPDRMPRRHLRMLRAVARIELQECADEPAAVAREAELLLELRPRFNRAGTWRGPDRHLGWRLSEAWLELIVREEPGPGWNWHGPMGAGAIFVRAALARLLWCALQPEAGIASLPEGWFRGRLPEETRIPLTGAQPDGRELAPLLKTYFAGESEPLCAWIAGRTSARKHPFESAAREADLETLSGLARGATGQRPESDRSGTGPRGKT